MKTDAKGEEVTKQDQERVRLREQLMDTAEANSKADVERVLINFGMALAARGLNKATAAAKFGVDPQWVSISLRNMEISSNISLNVLERLACIAGVSLQSLLGPVPTIFDEYKPHSTKEG